MDRAHTTPKPHASPPPQPHLWPRLEGGSFHSALGDQVLTLFGPLHYEPRYAYPLIVWLHGPGADEQQLLRIMPMVSMRNYVAVAPRGLRLCAAGGLPAKGFAWPETEDGVCEAAARVFCAVRAASEKYHIARDRVFLAGFDSGGTMALRLAMGWAEQFAGVASFGGRFPQGGCPLVNLSRARRLAVFLAVGRRSQSYPTSRVCADLRLLHVAGMWVTLRQYPCDHELAPQMLGDMDRWIIEQITASNSSRAAVEEPPSNSAA